MSTPETVTFSAQLEIGEYAVNVQVSAPKDNARPRDLLPEARDLSDGLVNLTTKVAADKGIKVSCKKGCGACCRQLVPISETEARMIRDLVDLMPEPRRSEIRQRFTAARAKLQDTGLLGILLQPGELTDSEMQSMAPRYFRLGIACPFLEEESCSIYDERPLRCREYLVSSQPVFCADPTQEHVRHVTIPLKIWKAAARLNEPPEGSKYIRWVPLSVAPEWADAHPGEEPASDGDDLVRRFLGYIAEQQRRSPAT